MSTDCEPNSSPLQIVNYDMFSDSDSESEDGAAPTVPENAAAVPREEEAHLQQQHREDEPPRSPDVSSDEQSESDSDRSMETVHLTPRKLPRKYALAKKEIPLAIVQLLKAVKEHFTKPLYLKRQARPISKSTFDKAYERICCEFIYILYLRVY